MVDSSTVAVACSPAMFARGRTLARVLGLNFLGPVDPVAVQAYPYLLVQDDAWLSLVPTGSGAAGPVRCDFVSGKARHRRLYGGGKSQAIAKATGVSQKSGLRIADLTAGMGEDAFALAALGADVIMVERDPLVYRLLRDGLRRAQLAAETDSVLEGITGRLQVYGGDGLAWLREVSDKRVPEVIYLDPMFPERRKSAKSGKTMEVLQDLLGTDPDAGELLAEALQRALYRVVVKRPVQAPWLGDRRPGYCLKGKAVRFDIYPLRSIRLPYL